jgi:hypothetical protein
MLPNAGRHAYGGFRKTLCGIERPDMTGSQFGMWGGRPSDDCPGCTAAPLDEESFAGDFAWFGDPGDPLGYRTAVTDPIAADLAGDGLSLPADFLALITRASLHRCLDREDGSAWTDVAGPLPSPANPADRMVLFFRDQQSCIMWYLYLHHSGRSAVVCSDRDFTDEPGLMYGPDGEIVPPRPPEIFWCAPSVEIFAYRFLVEARLWFAIHDKQRAGELDSELLAYLAHYMPRPARE